MLGRFRFNDEPLTGDDGRYDSPFVVTTFGVLLPLAILGLAVYAAIDGGITLRGRHGPSVRYEGFQAVASLACACIGVSLLLISKYLLPNVFRQSYSYQYFAIVGVALALLGMIWFVVAAIV